MSIVASLSAAVVIAVFLGGCAPAGEYALINVPPAVMNDYLADKPPALHPQFRKVLTEGSRNRVLNLLQSGLAAMDVGRYDLAEATMDDALLQIENIYGSTPRAKKARSLWYNEGMKEFKGEPYERAMAYYVRGLLYLRKGDFENARACFKSGTLQDAFAEEQQKRCDFALLIFLTGWASQCAGDDQLAEAAYDEVKRLRPDFQLPQSDHNVLIIAETGTSPRKVADGIGHYELKYRRGRHFTESAVRLAFAGRKARAYPMEDIAWQAMTRGGRPIDKIIKGKVEFKETNEKMATALTDASSTLMVMAPAFKNSDEVQAVAVVLGLVGLAQFALSARVATEADIRYWNNLPNAVHVYTCKLPPGDQSVSASFLNPAGSVVPGIGSRKQIYFPDGHHGIAWLRSRSAVVP